jgi:hypothetical protein
MGMVGVPRLRREGAMMGMGEGCLLGEVNSRSVILAQRFFRRDNR